MTMIGSDRRPQIGTDRPPEDAGPRSRILRPAFIGKAFLGVVLAFVGLNLAFGSWFVVLPTERAFTRVYGKVTTTQPIGPGLHFKWPFIETVDKMQVSSDTVLMPDVDVFTKDTQSVQIQLGVTYSTPDSAVYHLMYEVGGVGNSDIGRNITITSNDRLRSVIAQHTVTEVAGPDRESVVSQVKTVVAEELNRFYKIQVQDVQLVKFVPPKSYTSNIEAAVNIRAQKLAAELNRDKAAVDAETMQINAKAAANQAIETARGDKEKQILAAQAAAEKLRLDGEANAAAREALGKAEAAAILARGEAEAEATAAKIKAAGGSDAYVKQLAAEAQKNWTGNYPTTMIVSGNGEQAAGQVVPLLNLPSTK